MDQIVVAQEKAVIINALVSILMPAYNAEEFIEESILSVIAQTYKHWELIIIDDGSTDNTSKIVEKFALTDKRIKYLYQNNQRQAAARNFGLQHSQGDWIAFLDADDLWMPEKLEAQLHAASKYNAQIVFSNGYRYFFPQGTLSEYPTKTGLFSGTEMYKLLVYTNQLPILSVIMTKKVVELVGPQDVSDTIHGCEDYDYWLRASKLNVTFYGVQHYLFRYRIHNSSTSNDNGKMLKAMCHVIYNNVDYNLIPKEELIHFKRNLYRHLSEVIHQAIITRDKEVFKEFLNIGVKSVSPKRFGAVKIIFLLLGFKGAKIISRII